MSVSDGQPVNATVTNAAYMSRVTDTDTVGEVDLKNVSYTDLISLQRIINEMLSSLGMANQAATDASADTYSSNNVVTNGQDRKVAIGSLDERFNGTTGHTHDGTDGEGAAISASNLSDFNNLFAEFGEYTFNAASGTSIDVSSLYSGQSPGGDAVTAGVITSAPDNYVSIREKDTGGEIEDAQGDRVYARLTESGGTWTLSFYTNEAGTETAHTLASQDIRFLYREVFTAANRPTIGANVGVYDTQSAVGDIPDASATQRGVVSTSAQSFAGVKDFTSRPTVNAVDVVDISASQVITNKDIDGGTASNTSRITLPKNTTAGLDALTDKEATIAYDTDKDTVVYNDGVDWKELTATALGGGGGLDVFHTQTFEDFTALLSSGNNSAFLGGGTLDGAFALEAVSPIAGLQSGKYTAGAASLNDYIEIEAINLDLKQRGTLCKVRLSADMSGFANDVTFVVYDKTNANVLTTSLDVLVASEGRKFYEFLFETDSTTTQISYGFHMLSTPVNTELFIFDDVEFTTNALVEADFFQATGWESFTPTGTWSSPATVTYSGFKRRVGSDLEFKILVDVTSPPSGTLNIDMPSGLTIDTAKILSTGAVREVVGHVCIVDSDVGDRLQGKILVEDSGTPDRFRIASFIDGTVSSRTALSSVNGTFPITFISGDEIYIEGRVPVLGWETSSPHIVTPAKTNLTDWEDWTPTGSWTNVVYTGKKRQVGGDIEYQVRILCNSGAPTGTSVLTVNIPDTIDTSRLLFTTGGAAPTTAVGFGSAIDSGNNNYALRVGYETTTSIDVQVSRADGTYTFGDEASHNAPFTFNTNDHVDLYFKVPIVGLDANPTFLAALPYRKVKLALDNNFTAGEILVERIFDLVTITHIGGSTHSSGGSASSSNGLIPSWARPDVIAIAVANVSTNGPIYRIDIDTTGRYRHLYYDEALAFTNLTGVTGKMSIQYSVGS